MLRLFIVLVAACGAADPGLRKPTAPLPTGDGVHWSDTTFAGRGVSLYAQSWRPDGDVKAVVVIHHGLYDHGARYAAFAERLVHDGYAVWAMDMRGHGRSSGEQMRADRIDDYLDDLDAFMRLVREREPGKPIYLFAHSLGGLIAALYAVERQPPIAGLALSGPGIAFDAPPIQAAAIRMIAAIAPGAPILALDRGSFSSNPAMPAQMAADPLLYQHAGEARTARAAIDGAARVWAAPERIAMPLLVVAGSADKLVAPSGGRDLVAHAGTKDASFILYDGFNHDLMHEPDAARVMADIQTWLDAHVAGHPATPPALTTQRLTGDRGSGFTSVELDARGEDHDGVGVTAGLRARFGLGPYAGGLDLRAGSFPDGRGALYEADLHAVGLGLRADSGASASVTGGIGIGGVRGASATHLPVELSLEAPLGPIRALARAGAGWRLSGPRYASDAHGIADELDAMLGIRLGRDRHYWAHVVAGAGPYVAVTYRDLGGVEFYGVELGVELWGSE
jgi:alpha-beta hydrolase superfamily lysophospholipase